MPERNQIFLSYSHHDKKWRDRLHTFLKPLERNRGVLIWSDDRIDPGKKWLDEINQALDAAKIAVLLVSPNFLGSDFITNNELPPLLSRAKSEGVQIFWIAISASLFEESEIKDYQAARDPTQPLDVMAVGDRNKALLEIAHKIRSAFDVQQAERTVRSEAPIFHVPFRRNPYFTGRNGLVEKIEGTLQECKSAVLFGMGGIGKTQTAIEYAYQRRENYRTIISARADTNHALDSSLLEIGNLLYPTRDGALERADQISRIKRWLEDRSDWLFILDNVDDPDVVEPILPAEPKGHILMTSRSKEFERPSGIKCFELALLVPQEATEYLLKRTGRAEFSSAERLAAAKLAEELGYLPLALEQVGAFVTANQVPFDDYLKAYRQQSRSLVIGPIATVWSMNLAQVEKNPASGDLLRLMAFLAPDRIPLEIPAQASGHLGPNLAAALAGVNENPLLLYQILRPLTRYSLIRRDIADRSCSIHRIVQDVLRDGLDEATKRVWAERAVEAVSSMFPEEVGFEKWAQCERLMPHAVECSKWIDQWGYQSSGAGYLLNQAASYADDRGRYAESEALYRQALAIRECHAESQPLPFAETLNDLGYLYGETGRFAEAEPLYRKSLQIRERELQADDLAIATTLNNWGMLCRDENRYTEADAMLQRSLSIREKRLGPDDPRVGSALNNLAKLEYRQNHYPEAERLYRRALEIRKASLGPGHPKFAATLKNLADLWKAQGHYTKAQPYYLEAIHIREEALGPEHPKLAEGFEGYADLLQRMDRPAEAQPLLERAKAIRSRIG